MHFRPIVKLAVAVLAAPLFLAAQNTPVIQLQNLAHAVESLDKTVPFYRDVIGLPVNGARDPLTQQPQALDDDMQRTEKLIADEEHKKTGLAEQPPSPRFSTVQLTQKEQPDFLNTLQAQAAASRVTNQKRFGSTPRMYQR